MKPILTESSAGDAGSPHPASRLASTRTRASVDARQNPTHGCSPPGSGTRILRPPSGRRGRRARRRARRRRRHARPPRPMARRARRTRRHGPRPAALADPARRPPRGAAGPPPEARRARRTRRRPARPGQSHCTGPHIRARGERQRCYHGHQHSRPRQGSSRGSGPCGEDNPKRVHGEDCYAARPARRGGWTRVHVLDTAPHLPG